jgi:hypothetical protein
MTKRSPFRGECTSVIATPSARANPAISASRLVAAAQLFGAAVVAAPGMLEAAVAAEGEVRDALLGLLDCVDEYEALMACPPVRATG